MAKLQKEQSQVQPQAQKRFFFSRRKKQPSKHEDEVRLRGQQDGAESTSTLVVQATTTKLESPDSLLMSTPTTDGQSLTVRSRHTDGEGINQPLNVTLESSRQFSHLVTGETLHQFLWTNDDEEPFSDRKTQDVSQHPLSTLPDNLWNYILRCLSPIDAVNFMLCCRKLRGETLDGHLPNELLCFLCGVYHQRLLPGAERLLPMHASNPVFDCANARKLPLPRMRLTDRQELPYSLVQLAMRAQRYSPNHGIPLKAISRVWRCRDSDWSHNTRFHFHKGHLLLRLRSTSFARSRLTPSEERLLLFSRHDYLPYFSVCDHWQNGELIRLTKCALSHIPTPKKSIVDQMREGPRIDYSRLLTPNYMPRQCNDCKPMRRCPECPTEYLIEIRIAEDKRAQGIERFKHAIVVTRWSDLGDGSSPSSIEWAACNGKRDYDSFAAVKNASICSLFEAATNNYAPNQTMLSLGKRKGQTGDHVY